MLLFACQKGSGWMVENGISFGGLLAWNIDDTWCLVLMLVLVLHVCMYISLDGVVGSAYDLGGCGVWCVLSDVCCVLGPRPGTGCGLQHHATAALLYYDLTIACIYTYIHMCTVLYQLYCCI